MIRQRIFLSAALLSSSLFAVALAATQSPAIANDPAPDKAHPAAIESFQLPSHGALLNAFVYVASGAGPHPAVILLHGFPGNERNLDLAQAIRRAGWDVLYFNYRGSWGSPGGFSFTHSIEDTQSAIAYLRDPANAAKLRSDPANIVLIGHSMGGFMALEAGARDPGIRAIVTISAADMSGGRRQAVPAANHDLAVKSIARGLASQGMAPLAGTTPETLANEVLLNAAKWNFLSLAPGLATRPMLVITSDDGLAPSNIALADAVKKAGDRQVIEVHFPTDHSYSDHRIALEQAVLDGLTRFNQK